MVRRIFLPLRLAGSMGSVYRLRRAGFMVRRY
jgi:hypothetical protein